MKFNTSSEFRFINQSTVPRSPVLSRILVLAPFAFALAFAQPARGDDPPPEPPPAEAKGAQEEDHQHDDTTVTVHGRTPAPSRGASDFNLRVGELSRVPRQNAADLLKLAPGILLTNKGGDGHAEQVFLRGFDAREGQDIEFTVGGVPINEAGNLHGNGYADLHFIIPELVEGLRVIEGPFDPRQGNFAVAGSAAYDLGLTRRGLSVKYTHGSFATRRMLLLWGPTRESTHTFAGAELFDTDGFGQNRGAKRGSAMGQYEGRLGSGGSWRIGAQAYTSQYKSAGVVRADDVASERIGFFDTYDRRQGGDSSRYSVWGDIETKSGDTLLKQQVFFVMRDMRLRENFTGFLLDVQQAQQNPHVQRGDFLDLHVDSQTLGARGSARWRTKALDQTQELELGYFARADRTASSQHRLEARRRTRRTSPRRILDSRLGNLGIYGDAGLRPFGWLTFRGGARGDIFTYDVLDACAQRSVRKPSAANPPGDQSCLSQQDDAASGGVRYREPHDWRGTASIAVMPRGSVLVGPFTGFTASVSLGKGIRSIDPVYINQDLPTPFANVEAGELGMSYARGVGDVELMARSIFFQTHVDKRPHLQRDRRARDARERDDAHRLGRRREGDRAVVRSGRERHLRALDVRRYAPARPVRARRRRALGHGDRSRAAVPSHGREAHRRARDRDHVRRPPRAAVRTAQRRDLHDRRFGVGRLAHVRGRARGDQLARSAISPQRVQLRLRLPKRAAADARARPPLRVGGAARDVLDPHRHARRYVMATLCSRRVARVAVVALACALGGAGAACTGTTGSEIVSFEAFASGPADLPPDTATRGLSFTNPLGWSITLTRARLHIGAVYLNRSAPISGGQERQCFLPGIYVAQVTTGMDVDALSSALQPFPAAGSGTADHAVTGEVWLTGGRIDEPDDFTPIAQVAGTATRGGESMRFEGTVTIGKNRKNPDIDRARPGAEPLCSKRIVTNIPTSITPTDGGALVVRVDPRAWFANVELGELEPVAPDDDLRRIPDAPAPPPADNLYRGLRGAEGVYRFEWLH